MEQLDLAAQRRINVDEVRQSGIATLRSRSAHSIALGYSINRSDGVITWVESHEASRLIAEDGGLVVFSTRSFQPCVRSVDVEWELHAVDHVMNSDEHWFTAGSSPRGSRRLHSLLASAPRSELDIPVGAADLPAIAFDFEGSTFAKVVLDDHTTVTIAAPADIIAAGYDIACSDVRLAR